MTKQTQLEGYKNTLRKLTKREKELDKEVKEAAAKQKVLIDKYEKIVKTMVEEGEEKLPYLSESKASTLLAENDEKLFELMTEFYRVALRHTKRLTQLLQILSLKNEYEFEIRKLERENKVDAANFRKSARDIMASVEVGSLEQKLRRDQIQGVPGWIVPHYIVNAEKGVVVVLLKSSITGLTHFKAKAKVAPGDTFNETVGKAIALRRALGLRELSILTGRNERG